MSNCQVETGYQLFARLNTDSRLVNIYPKLFPDNGPKQREVIEISGDSSTGKTFFITEIIAKCLLPDSIYGELVGGKNAGAVIINTDHHFNMFKLTRIMEHILQNFSCRYKLPDTKINDLISESLKNLVILNCYNSHQLNIAIHNLENIFSNNNKLSLLVLDSISAYYWTDRINGGPKQIDSYQKSILRLLQNATKEYNTVIMFTKYTEFSSKKVYVERCCEWPSLEKINYRIFLEKSLEEDCFIAQITPPSNEKNSRKYKIRDVIEWIR